MYSRATTSTQDTVTVAAKTLGAAATPPLSTSYRFGECCRPKLPQWVVRGQAPPAIDLGRPTFSSFNHVEAIV